MLPSRVGEVVPVPTGPDTPVVQNTAAAFAPDIVWGKSPNDAALVISNSPEALTDRVFPGPVGTLYADLSGASQSTGRPSSHVLTGRVHVFVFHTNHTERRLDIGFTVRNASSSPGRLRYFRQSGQGESVNAVKLAQGITLHWFTERKAQAIVREEALDPARTASFWVPSVPAPLPSGDAHTAFLWYDVELVDGEGAALPLDIQCWVREHGTTVPTWGAPVLEPTGPIRATLPHSYGHVTFPYDVVANGVVCLDMNSQSPSQARTGACNTAPAGWPTNQPAHHGQAGCTAAAPPYLTSGAVALARAACRNAFGEWCYAADPLGFDQNGPAHEYVEGWDWVDQALDGAPDPTEPGFWYDSVRWGRRLPRFNYGEYGVEVAFTFRSPDPARRFRVGLTQAYALHSIPWAWYDESTGRADAVPWHLIAGGFLSDRNQYLVADGATDWTFVTTLTAGAWAPLRILVQPAPG